VFVMTRCTNACLIHLLYSVLLTYSCMLLQYVPQALPYIRLINSCVTVRGSAVNTVTDHLALVIWHRPQYLVNCCHPTSDVASRQRLQSSSRHHLVVPRHRCSTLGRRAFSVAGPMAWNALPDDLRDPSLSADNFRWNALGHLAH